MALGNPSDDLPAYARFLLLFLAEAIVGVALYSLFTRTPVALQMLFFAVAAVVVRLAHYNIRTTKPSRPYSVDSLLVSPVFAALCRELLSGSLRLKMSGQG